MKNIRVLFAVLALASFIGCSSHPPKPPECKGEFKPVNIVDPKGNNKLDKVVKCFEGIGNGKQG